MDEINVMQTPLTNSLMGARTPQTSLGRDDFLKILITQLQNQDPTAPMEDKEFIAQMAQFSALEQMTQMSSDFQQLTQNMQSQNALDLLGRSVTVAAGDQYITGVVSAVTTGGAPQVQVQNQLYGLDSIAMVHEGGTQ